MDSSHALTIFADYHQVHIEDVGHHTGEGPVWTDETVETMLALGPGVVAFGTARNMEVPVRVELHDGPPDVDERQWDQIAECFINSPSGRVSIKGPTDYDPTSFDLELPSTQMTVRIMWGGLDSVSEDGIEGNDHYVIQIWPGDPQPVSYPKKRIKDQAG